MWQPLRTREPVIWEVIWKMNDCPECGIRSQGEGTKRKGYGKCRRCSTRFDEEMWVTVFKNAKRLQIDPWTALLETINLTAGRLMWIEEQLDNADEDDTPELVIWIREARKERELLARASKAAIDAGIAERMVRDKQLEGKVVAQMLNAVINKLNLSEEQKLIAYRAMKFELQKKTPQEIEGAVTKVTG